MLGVREISTVEIGGGQIEYEYRPPVHPAARVLVFLHEGLGSAALWRDFPERLAGRSGYGSLVYSRFGNGFSSVIDGARTPRYMHDEGEAVLPELLDALQIRSAAFFGHSDGASIALIFAGAFPERATALVLEAPHVFVEEHSIAGIARIGERFRAGEFRSRMARHHRDVDATFESWNRIWLSPEFRTWNIEPYVERVRAPILCIQGEDDEYGTLSQIDAVASRNSQRTDRLILANCGHSPHRDRPAVVEGAVASWLAEAARPAR